MKNGMKMGIGIVLLILLSVVFVGCTDRNENLTIAIQNSTNIEQKVFIYVDGNDVGYIYIKAGEKEFISTEYEEGEHFVKIIGTEHHFGETVNKNVQFDLHQDGSVTYFEW